MQASHDISQAGQDHLIPEAQLAAHWHKSLRTLQRWRNFGTGPAYLKIGGSIFYRPSDIAAYEASCRKAGR